MGVAGDVGDGLGGDAVGGDLDRRRQRRELVGGVHLDPERGVGRGGEGGGLLTQRPHQAQLVQGGGPQGIDQPADVDQQGLDAALQPGELGVGTGRVAAEHGAGGADLQRQAGQGRAQAVVQVAPQPTPLLLPGADQPLAGALQVGGQTDGVDRHPDLAGEVLQQLAVGGGQRLPGRPRAHGQLADHLPLVDQREADRLAAQVPVAGGRAVLASHLDRDVGQPQALSDRLHQRGQHRLGLHRGLQATAQAAQRGVRVVAVAVQQLVGPPLQP